MTPDKALQELMRTREVKRGTARGTVGGSPSSRKLNLREHTVRNYVFRCFEKLGISSKVDFAL